MSPPDPLPSGLTPWPIALAERYRAAGLWSGRTLGAVLRGWAETYADHIALVSGADRLTYRVLDSRVDRMAAGFADRGVRAGERVVIQLPNRTEFVVAIFALVRVGAVPVLTLPAHRSREIVALAARSDAVAYIIADRHGGFDYRDLAATVGAQVPSVRDVFVAGEPGAYTALTDVDAVPRALPEPDPADVALMLISGGTTGVPKLIPRTHDDYAFTARASAEVCGLNAESVYLAALPVAHNFPLACPGVLGTLSCGGTAVLAASAAPADAFALIKAEGVTVTALVPPLIPVWLEAAEWERPDLSSLRVLQAGGSRLPAELARTIPNTLGARVQQVYGMAEGLLNFTRTHDSAELVEQSQGRPLSEHDELLIVDRDGVPVPVGTPGELWTRGPYTVRGYFEAPEHNATSFSPDGFYRTGDLVRRLPTGHLVVEGRVEDSVHRGGETVAVGDIENELGQHPNVGSCAIIGLPSSGGDERLCAVVVPVDGKPLTLLEIREFLLDRGLAAFKLPDQVQHVGALPLTAIGKVDRKALRNCFGVH